MVIELALEKCLKLAKSSKHKQSKLSIVKEYKEDTEEAKDAETKDRNRRRSNNARRVDAFRLPGETDMEEKMGSDMSFKQSPRSIK